MPFENPDSLSKRVQSSYQRLSAVASDLNAASDDFGRVILSLEEALRKLNLGIASWYEYAEQQNDNGSFWSRYIGYTKIGTKWGIALRRTSGHEGSEDGTDDIPEMIDKLIADAEKAVEKIKRKTAEAQQLAYTVTAR